MAVEASRLILFDPIGTIMNLFDPIGTNMNLFDPI